MASYTSSTRSASSKNASMSSTKMSSSLAFTSDDVDDDDTDALEAAMMDIKMDLPQARLPKMVEKRISMDSPLDAMISEALGDRKGSLTSKPGCTAISSAKSKSTSSSAKLETSGSIVGGELVTNKTVAEKDHQAKESQSEKRVEDGKVVVDKKQSHETSDKAKLKSTKAMSQEELDAFFRIKANSPHPIEELQFDEKTKTFDVKLQDLPEFSPDELTVKIVDGVITVIGRHEDQSDENNYKSEEYIRKFTVPKGLNNENVAWTLEPEGVLAISAGTAVKGLQVYHLDCTLFRPKSFFKNK